MEALERVKAERFDAVISDIRMSGLDGPELLRLAAVWQPGAHTFLMTAFDVPAGIGSEFSGIFNKPFEFAEVVAKLRSVLPTPPGSGAPSHAKTKEKGV
jgi:CheY-like chemotaxis protein